MVKKKTKNKIMVGLRLDKDVIKSALKETGCDRPSTAIAIILNKFLKRI